MQKEFDDTNWKQEILGSLEFNQSKFASKLLKDGARSYMQSIYLGYLYTRWKKLKGYDKLIPNLRVRVPFLRLKIFEMSNQRMKVLHKLL